MCAVAVLFRWSINHVRIIVNPEKHMPVVELACARVLRHSLCSWSWRALACVLTMHYLPQLGVLYQSTVMSGHSEVAIAVLCRCCPAVMCMLSTVLPAAKRVGRPVVCSCNLPQNSDTLQVRTDAARHRQAVGGSSKDRQSGQRRGSRQAGGQACRRAGGQAGRQAGRLLNPLSAVGRRHLWMLTVFDVLVVS